jgi:tRNA G10  N-methylase Trm11
MVETGFRSWYTVGVKKKITQPNSKASPLVGKIFLKLRSNIVLDGDVALAEREVRAFFSSVERFSAENFLKAGIPEKIAFLHIRKGVCSGFLVSGTNLTADGCARMLNFTQEAWLLDPRDTVNVPEALWARRMDDDGRQIVCVLPFMACGEILSQVKGHPAAASDVGDLCAFLGGDADAGRRLRAPSTGGTSTQHVHALHKYKAKFFPRLIRSFLVEYLERLPKRKDGTKALLDPFVGSGTALIEASLLGMESAGVDIDLLSCEIARAKIAALSADPLKVEDALAHAIDAEQHPPASAKSYIFPSAIVKKFERWNAPQERSAYEQEITKWRSVVESIPNEDMRKLFGICLSDALTRKFVIRMMGTGVGRFALEIAKTSLDRLMSSNMVSAFHSVRCARAIIDAYGITPAKANVRHGSAVSLPFEDESFSVILTSPPYLPASSGREDYLVGKAISNVALGLMSDEEITKAEESSVGSMKWLVMNASGLPTAVMELHDWLAADPLRDIKARPTLAYYVSLKKALEENFRVLLPGGIAIYVIGKESVFYKFSTREVLYRVDCDRIFHDIAISCGFKVEEKVDVELDKKNKNARPRSLDSFYESVFVLKKPTSHVSSVS